MLATYSSHKMAIGIVFQQLPGKKITDLSLVTVSFYSIKDPILDGGIQQASAPMLVLLRHPHPQGMTATARGVTPTQPAMECCSIYSLADKLIQS